MYFSNAEIYSKLKGYSRLQATLNVKVTINASPYQYGLGIMSYVPLDNSSADRFSGGWVSSNMDSNVEIGSSIVTSRPHVFFYPQFSRGCEMTLPFMYYKNWVNLDSDLSEVSTMGRLNLRSLVPLLTTSDPAVLPITITVYAWCSDFKVAAPSYSLQAGDEYAERPVSTTASALSKAAASLSMITPLRPYAMATSMILSKLGEMARWFGFSNPPVISDVHASRINLMPQYSSPEVSVQFDKLALDPKNEVTVDSRTVGLDGVDHMAIEHINNRDIGLNIVEWRASDLPVTPLYMAHVTPMYSGRALATASTTGKPTIEVQMTPSAHVGSVFDFWRGSMTYRFTAIASQFHRGRLLVSFDPDGWKDTYTTAAYLGPRTISKVWDIQQNSDFEFEIPYMAPSAMLRTGGMIGQFTDRRINRFVRPSPPGTFYYEDQLYNGTLIVSVLNALSSNNPAANINIFVRFNAKMVEYSNPREIELPVSNYQLQSGEATTLSAEPDQVQEASVNSVVQADHVIYTGEVVRSIRTLMHRTNRLGIIPYNTFWQDPKIVYSTEIPFIDNTTSVDGNTFQFEYVFPMLPLVGGFIPHTIPGFLNGQMIKSDGANSVPNQTLRFPTVTAYLSAAYVGWRGSHRYHAKLPYVEKKVLAGSDGSGGAWNVAVRDFAFKRHLTSMADQWDIVITNFSSMMRRQVRQGFATLANRFSRGLALAAGARRAVEFGVQGASGMTVTAHTVQPVVDAVFPYYSNFRMMPCNPLANYISTYDNNRLSWNYFDETIDNTWLSKGALTTVIDIDSNASTPFLNVATMTDQFPALDVYHAAGADFSCFMYLNPPTYYCYTESIDGFISGWML